MAWRVGWVRTADPERAAEWRDIFGTAQIPVKAVLIATAPGVPLGRFYTVDLDRLPPAARVKVVEVILHAWPGQTRESVERDLAGEHGLPIIDKGDLTYTLDVRDAS